MSEKQVKNLLIQKFDNRHVDSTLRHFKAAIEKYSLEDWEGVGEKAGKFVEAVTKALMVFCKKPLPFGKHFKAGVELGKLGQVSVADAPDSIRLVIPKACLFIYDVASNRGGRHDANDIDANAIDSTTIVPLLSWVLAEMVRICSTGRDTALASSLIEELTNKTYPYFENIDGRTYVNCDGLKGPEYALLLLYDAYPKRINRKDLKDAIIRHGIKQGAAAMVVNRLTVVDDDNGNLKLRANGREKAEMLLKKIKSKS